MGQINEVSGTVIDFTTQSNKQWNKQSRQNCISHVSISVILVPGRVSYTVIYKQLLYLLIIQFLFNKDDILPQ